MINDPLPDALDGVDNAVEDSRHHVATGGFNGIVEVLRYALECIAQQAPKESGNPAKRRSDDLGQLIHHAVPVDCHERVFHVFANLPPVDLLDGTGD